MTDDRRDSDVCMFCLQSDGPFKSREHIVPESLGNKEMMLPPGYVCDRCNNGPLSQLDNALIRCPPVALIKTTRYIKSKRNRLPKAMFGEAGLYAVDVDGESGVQLCVPDPGDVIDREGSFEVTLRATWSPRGWSQVSRAILKMGLQHLALELGKEAVLDKRFDGVRRSILVGGSAGWVAYTREVTPTDHITVFGAEGEPGSSPARLLAGVELFGLRFTTAWPAEERLLAMAGVVPGSDNLRIERFPKDAADTPIETITMATAVEYGSREEWTEPVRVSRDRL